MAQLPAEGGGSVLAERCGSSSHPSANPEGSVPRQSGNPAHSPRDEAASPVSDLLDDGQTLRSALEAALHAREEVFPIPPVPRPPRGGRGGRCRQRGRRALAVWMAAERGRVALNQAGTSGRFGAGAATASVCEHAACGTPPPLSRLCEHGLCLFVKASEWLQRAGSRYRALRQEPSCIAPL